MRRLLFLGLLSFVSIDARAQAPATPTGLAGSALGVSSMSWTWSPVSGATSYNLYFSTGGSPANIVATFLIQTQLSTNTVYGAQVSAVNPSGESALSSTVQAYTASAVPISVTLSQVRVTSAAVSYGANGNPAATNYLVEASTVAGFSPVLSSALSTATVQTLTNLFSGTTYFIRVRSQNGSLVYSAAPASVSTVTLPAAPATVTAVTLGVSSVTWSWAASSGTTGYNFYPSTGGAAISFGAAVLTYTQTQLSTNTAYGATVTAKNLSGEGPGTAGTANTAAAVPNSLTVSGSSQTTITAGWSPNTNPAGTTYQLEASTSSNFAVLAGTQLSTATGGVAVTGLTSFTTYYLQVRARNGLGALTAASTSVSTATLAQAASGTPGGFFGLGQGVSSISWNWSSVAAATGYNFYPSTGGPAILVGTTGFFQTGLSTNTAYGGQVAAVNSGGEGPRTGTAVTYTLSAVPQSPAVTAVFVTSATLGWSANTNSASTNYRVEGSTSAAFTTTANTIVTATTASLTGLTSGTSYFFRVISLSGDAAPSSPSASISSQTLSNAPQTLSAAALGASSITWTWSVSTGASTYFLYPSTGGSPFLVATTSFIQTGLSTNTVYGAFVAGRNGGGTGPTTATQTGTTLAAPPTGLALLSVGVTTVTVQWQANGNSPGTNYRVDVATVAGFANVLSSVTVAVTSASVTGLTAGSQYFLQVQALNGAGFASGLAPSVSTVTLSSTPASLFGAGLGVSSISWTWAASSGATSYNFYPSTGGSPINLATTFYFQTNLSTNTNYGAAISAKVGSAEGPVSAVTSARTLAAPATGFAFGFVGISSASFTWAFNTNPPGTTPYLVEASTLATFLSSAAASVFTSTPAILSGLGGGNTYFFRIRSQNTDGFPSSSAPVLSSTTLPTLPNAPLGLAATSLGVSSVAWTWNPSTGATGYNFYFSTGGSISLSATSYLQLGLTTATAYGARVSGKNVSGEGPLTSQVTGYTLASVPSGFAFLFVGISSASTSASSNGNPIGTTFVLEASTAAGFSPNAATAVSTQTILTVGSLSGSTSYFFRLAAVNGGGVYSAYTNSLSSVTLPGPPSLAPSGLGGTALGVSSITWSWGTVSGATGYNFYPTTGGASIPLSGTTLTQTALSTNTAYGARVTAKNAGGEGPLTAITTAYTMAATPVAPAFVFVGISSAALSWGANGNSGGTQYALQVAVSTTFASVLSSTTVTQTSGTVTGLSPLNSYAFRVYALNLGGGLSAASSVLSSTTLPSPPSFAPASVTGTALGVSSISWTWPSVSSATAYNFYPDGGAAVAVATTSYIQTGLSTNTAHGASVTAKNSGGEGPATVAGAVYTKANPASGSSLVSVSSDSVTLQWSANTNPGGTDFKVSATAFGSSSGSTVTVTGLSASFTALTPATSWQFRVSAVNGDGLVSAADVLVATMTLSAVPSTPVGTGQSTSSILWSWTASSGAARYGFYPSTGGAAIPRLTPTFTQTALAVNTSYSAFVSAFTGSGESAYSATGTGWTLAAPATGSATPGVFGSSAAVSWGANGNPAWTSYRLALTAPYLSSTTLTVAGTSTSLTGLTQGTTYTLTVTALSGADVAAAADTPVVFTTVMLSVVQAVDATGGALANDFGHGPTTVTIPPNAFPQDVTVTLAPAVSFPSAATTPLQIQGTNVGISITVAEGLQPNQPVTLIISYRDADITGLDPSTLVVARYDPTVGTWVPLESHPDPANHRVIAITNHFSLFQMMSVTAAATIHDTQAFPNPMRPGQGDTLMTFSNLPAYARVRLYTLSGEKVREMLAGGSGVAQWDGTNDGGQKVASGVYIALIEKGKNQAVKKVAVER